MYTVNNQSDYNLVPYKLNKGKREKECERYNIYSLFLGH